MTPSEYEALVAEHFRALGYSVDDRPDTSDWGVDVMASKGAERVAIQVKMYGGSARPVNRAMLMELSGAAAYFGSDHAVLATDGRILPDALLVAERLGIEVLRLEPGPDPRPSSTTGDGLTFDSIWERYAIPLAGETLAAADGRTNRIISADWSGIVRETSGGTTQRIGIEIFRTAVERILSEGSITRQEINDLYPGRASSGICLILAQVPRFVVGGRPITVRLRQ